MTDDRIAALEDRVAGLEHGIETLLQRIPDPGIGRPSDAGSTATPARAGTGPQNADAAAERPALTAAERPVPTTAAGAVPPAASDDTGPADDTLWALEGLQRRLASPGAVMLVGTVDLPDGRVARWQEGRTTGALLDDDWAEAADTLAALAHPVRLRLLRRLLDGAQTARELTELDGMGTSGQVYHHLRHLSAAGWLRSLGSGRFEIPAERMVPLLTTVLGGRR